MTPLPVSRSSRVDALDWISLGLVASACVLWLAFARTDPVAAFVFGVRPGQPISSPDFVLQRYEAVWAGGIAIAVGLTVAGVALRRRPIDGRSPLAWANLVAKLATLLAGMAIARELRGRAVTADMFIVFAGIAAAVVTAFWRGRRGSAAPKLPDA